ncbi:MAG: ABC transporter permease [Desulfuromonadales bacterium]|nr:ABC transporter permease [Desulfuromonadales bacterium]
MIELWMSVKIALRALRVNKLRAFLTMLGIICGIAAVIAMIAIGAGARQVISEQIASIGSNLLLVLPGSTTAGGLRTGAGSAATLTMGDLRAIRAEAPSVALAAPTVRGTAQIVFGNLNWSTAVQGTTPEFLEIREWPVVNGRPLTQTDVDGTARVALLGQTVAEQLFGAEEPVGRLIRIRQVPFTVVGVLERKGQSPQGSDQDDVILVPVRTAQRRLFGGRTPDSVNSILIKAVGAEALAAAQEEVTALLEQRHRIAPGKDRDFTIRNLSEMLAVSEQSSRTMSLLLGSVASISLLVGGIGIMNIMLVSVTERTREIGIRLAIGARRRDILLQFLTEAVLLTIVGGLLGIVFGVSGAAAVSRLLGWPTLIAAEAILVAVGFSAAVGIFFGFYPARKAASLDPIQALRYE